MKSDDASVRVASLLDESCVIAIDAVAAAGDAERPSQLRTAIRSGLCLVCERHGVVLGFAVVKPVHFFGRDFVELLFVSSDARRQGVGRSLLRAAVGASTTSRVFTSTNRSNLAMQGLLTSEGWSASGELVGLDDGDPELVYYYPRDEKR